MNALVRAPTNGDILGPADVLTVTASVHPLKPHAEILILPAGMSLAEIVEEVGTRCKVSRLSRGVDVSIDGHAIDAAHLSRVRVKAGAHVTLRARAGKGVGNILKSLLMIALAVATTFIIGPGGLTTLGLAGTIGGTAGAIVAAAAYGAIVNKGTVVFDALRPPTGTSTT